MQDTRTGELIPLAYKNQVLGALAEHWVVKLKGGSFVIDSIGRGGIVLRCLPGTHVKDAAHPARRQRSAWRTVWKLGESVTVHRAKFEIARILGHKKLVLRGIPCATSA